MRFGKADFSCLKEKPLSSGSRQGTLSKVESDPEKSEHRGMAESFSFQGSDFFERSITNMEAVGKGIRREVERAVRASRTPA